MKWSTQKNICASFSCCFPKCKKKAGETNLFVVQLTIRTGLPLLLGVCMIQGQQNDVQQLPQTKKKSYFTVQRLFRISFLSPHLREQEEKKIPFNPKLNKGQFCTLKKIRHILVSSAHKFLSFSWFHMKFVEMNGFKLRSFVPFFYTLIFNQILKPLFIWHQTINILRAVLACFYFKVLS